MDEIGSRVRELRKARNLTQKQLAAQAGLSEISIKTLEGGKYTPRGDTLTKLARAFGIPVSALLGEAAGPAPVAKWRSWGVSEDEITRYSALWIEMNPEQRALFDGNLKVSVDSSARMQALIQQVQTQAEALQRQREEDDDLPDHLGAAHSQVVA